MSFQSIVMSTSIIILIIVLAFIGLALYRQKYNSKFPPITANCPDYWIDIQGHGSGSGSKCSNVQNLGNPACAKTMNFSTAQWLGNNGLCSKQQWAKTCNITWDGISDNPDICDV